MKKYLLLVLCLFLVIGCSKDKQEVVEEEINNIKEEVKEEQVIVEEDIYKDENPIIVGLYQKGKLVKSINANIMDSTDIASFDVYFTNEEDVGSSNTKNNFNKYASNYEESNKYKIGFMISFTTEDESINKVITGPKDTYITTPYIYNYLYDDVHQVDGAWYSHVEEKDVNDETVYSSIKLYGAEYTNKINSPITLTVFTYDTEDDFDDNGMYRGNSKYSVTINKE